MDRHPRFKAEFEYEVMRLMSEIMAHTITLHLLDAPGRVHRFMRKHPELAERIPKKELAAYLNLSAETLTPPEAARQDLSARPCAARHAGRPFRLPGSTERAVERAITRNWSSTAARRARQRHLPRRPSRASATMPRSVTGRRCPRS